MLTLCAFPNTLAGNADEIAIKTVGEGTIIMVFLDGLSGGRYGGLTVGGYRNGGAMELDQLVSARDPSRTLVGERWGLPAPPFQTWRKLGLAVDRPGSRPLAAVDDRVRAMQEAGAPEHKPLTTAPTF